MLDLRSDALTVPTEDMWQRMREVECGWASKGEDPTVCELEKRGAELLGKEAALFVPTGTVGNLLALLVYARRGSRIVAEAESHVLWAEQQAFCHLAGAWIQPVAGVDGRMPLQSVIASVENEGGWCKTDSSLIWLENSHNASGGRLLTISYMKAIADIAHSNALAVHLDGARLFNAAAALEVSAREMVRYTDSVMFNLNKGLSAPYGALLCGRHEFIRTARVHLRRIGAGSIHQAGILAAAGIVALETMLDQPAVDNRTAASLASELGKLKIDGIEVPVPQSNIVLVKLDDRIGFDADMLLQALRFHGVCGYPLNSRTVRLAIHRHFRQGHISECVRAFSASLSHLTAAAPQRPERQEVVQPRG